MGSSDHRLRWPRLCRACAAPSPVFWPRARTCDLNRSPAMLSVPSARSKERVRTEPKSSAIIAATGEKSGLGGVQGFGGVLGHRLERGTQDGCQAESHRNTDNCQHVRQYEVRVDPIEVGPLD